MSNYNIKVTVIRASSKVLTCFEEMEANMIRTWAKDLVSSSKTVQLVSYRREREESLTEQTKQTWINNTTAYLFYMRMLQRLAETQKLCVLSVRTPKSNPNVKVSLSKSTAESLRWDSKLFWLECLLSQTETDLWQRDSEGWTTYARQWKRVGMVVLPSSGHVM